MCPERSSTSTAIAQQALGEARGKERAERMLFPGTAPVMAKLGGGSEGVSRVTFEGKEWDFNKGIHHALSLDFLTSALLSVGPGYLLLGSVLCTAGFLVAPE